MRWAPKHPILGFAIWLASGCNRQPEPHVQEAGTTDAGSDSAGETRLSRVFSSLTQPIDACGKDGERAWLISATCADGSHPAHSQQEARKLFEGSGRSSARVSVDLYRVACPERTYDVYMLSRSCPPEELRTRSRHDCFIIATNEPGVGIECLTGKKRELNPEDPECLQLLLTSPRAREACEIGVRVLNAARGGDLDKRCGSIWGVDHHSAVDGPYYYYDERTLRVVAVCGGACMGGHCKNCPPKEAACGHGPRAPTWQSMRRFYEAEFMAPASPSVDRDQ